LSLHDNLEKLIRLRAQVSLYMALPGIDPSDRAEFIRIEKDIGKKIRAVSDVLSDEATTASDDPRYLTYEYLGEGDVFAVADTGEHLNELGQLVLLAVYVKKKTCYVCVLSHNMADIGCAFDDPEDTLPVILIDLLWKTASYSGLGEEQYPRTND